MKKIAVLLPSFAVEYAQDLLNGIYDYFNGQDVKVIIAQTKLPHDNFGLFDYQYWSSIELLKAEEIDAYIVVTGLYCSGIPQDELEKVLMQFAPRPIISISVEINIPNSKCVVSDAKKSYYDVISHLKNVHHCTRIAFMSANGTKSAEALDRYESFLQAMKDNELEFDENLLFDGNFTDFEAEAVLSKVIKTKSNLNFDAIVSANDGMCVGCISALNKVGIKVPEEVKIVGFDDAIVASISKPKLSTINQQVYGLCYKAAQTAFDTVRGRKLPKRQFSSLFPKYRQSCGCIDPKNSEDIYINNAGELCADELSNASKIYQYYNDLDEKNNIITLIDMVKATYTLRQFFFNLSFIVGQINLRDAAISLFKEPIYTDENQTIVLPGEMEMYMYSDKDKQINSFRPEIFFNPRKKLFAHETISDNPGVYILQPIFSGEINYGFFLCKLNAVNFSTYNVYLKIIVTAISQAVEYTRSLNQNIVLESQNTDLKQNISDLSMESRTDELTGILNRRGFMEYGQRTLDIMQERSLAGMIFFGDMDGFKTINDTYGHNIGDLAIRIQAMALKKAFRNTDVVGRLSGDEFGIVASGMIEEQVEKTIEKVNEINKKFSKEYGLPFTLSITLGAVNLEDSSVLSQLLNKADKELYVKKREKKAAKAGGKEKEAAQKENKRGRVKS